VKISDFRYVNRNELVATFVVCSGPFEIEAMLIEQGNRRWIVFPAVPVHDDDDKLVYDAMGTLLCTTIIRIPNPSRNRAFHRQILALLEPYLLLAACEEAARKRAQHELRAIAESA